MGLNRLQIAASLQHLSASRFDVLATKPGRHQIELGLQSLDPPLAGKVLGAAAIKGDAAECAGLIERQIAEIDRAHGDDIGLCLLEILSGLLNFLRTIAQLQLL